jgi:predicted PurR-regulated permease PerM
MATATKTLPRKSAASLAKALRPLLLLALGTLLYVGHAAFIPVALAGLIALILSAPVEALHAVRIPRAVSALLLVVLIGGAVASLVLLLSEPAKHWYAQAPHTLQQVARKVRPVERVAARIEQLRLQATSVASPQKPVPPKAAPPPDVPSAPVALFDVTLGAALDVFTVIVLTLFFLIGGPPMLARMTAALVSDLNAAHVLCVIDQVRREVGRFYGTTALINAGLGLATGVAMLFCGMPNPFLWGTLVAVLNFIPYAGPTTSFALLTLVALVTFDDLPHVLTVSGSFLALTALESHCVQPLLVGRRLQLAPLLVFLALWFAWFFWGLAGIVLATPTLVVLKVIAEHSPRGAPVLEFLSPDGPERARARGPGSAPERTTRATTAAIS